MRLWITHNFIAKLGCKISMIIYQIGELTALFKVIFERQEANFFLSETVLFYVLMSLFPCPFRVRVIEQMREVLGRTIIGKNVFMNLSFYFLRTKLSLKHFIFNWAHSFSNIILLKHFLSTA